MRCGRVNEIVMGSQKVKSPPTEQQRKRWWLLGLLGAGVFVLGKLTFFGAQSVPEAPVSPLATVQAAPGELRRVIRLTGVTTAEKYADLIAPQMRGGRRGAGQGLSSISTSAGRRATASSASAVSSSRASSTSSASSAGSGRSTSSALRAATSRFGAGSSATASSSSASQSSTSSSTSSSSGTSASSGSSSRTTGSSGGGSTGGGGMVGGGTPGGGGRGGGGGGRGFFSSLVLKEVVKSGSKVRKGEIVAEFDQENMVTRLDDFRANVLLAEATLKSIDTQLDVIRQAHQQTVRVAKADLDKARLDLKTLPVRSAIESELLRLGAEEAEARYKQLLSEVKFMEASLTAQKRIADLELRETRAELKRLEANLDKMTIRAPLDGIVVMKTIWRGGEQGQIEKGDDLRPGQPFMQIVDTSSMLINALVNQVDADTIRLGAKAVVRFDAYPELELPATVHSVGAMPKTGGWRADFVKEIPVVLRLDRTDPRVIPDLSVSVDVLLEKESAPAIVPVESVFRDGPGGRPYVFLRQPSGWERREVELGLSNYNAVAIRSGVSAGEVIARERPPMIGKKQ